MGVWTAFRDGFVRGIRSDWEPSDEPTSPDEPAAPALPPEEPAQTSLSHRRAILLVVVAVVAALVLIWLLIHINGNPKVGDNPTARQAQAVLTILETIPVKGRAPLTGYHRSEFGRPWTDHVDVEGGHNGCDTRDDIMRRDLVNVVADTNGCRVLSGLLHDPYTGRDIAIDRAEGTAILIQIDHIVALKDAWQKGAQGWDARTRLEFANDPLNLLAVGHQVNKAKGDADVSTWLPPNKAFRCDYVTRVVEVKAKYGVWMTQAEHDAASRILTNCLSTVLPSTRTVFPSSGSSKYPITGSISPTSQPHPYYANCAEAHADGRWDIPAGDPAYRRALDGDGNGIACESRRGAR